jgi:hypothetical protein
MRGTPWLQVVDSLSKEKTRYEAMTRPVGRDSGHRILDSKFQIQDSKFEIHKHNDIWNKSFGTWNLSKDKGGLAARTLSVPRPGNGSGSGQGALAVTSSTKELERISRR